MQVPLQLYLKHFPSPKPNGYGLFAGLTNAVVVISEGQAMDMESESRAEVTEEEYVKIKETAELFAVSAEIGGLFAEIDGQRISNLRDYGMDLGIAFQIADDILGFTANGKELGKPIYSDIREGKKTTLLIDTNKKKNNLK